MWQIICNFVVNMRLLTIISALLLAVPCALAMEQQSVVADSIVVDSLRVDSLSVATTTLDSVPVQRDWFKELKRGKVNFEDHSIRYPKFLRTVWNGIKWFNRSLNNYDTTYVAGTGKKFKLTVKNNNWLDYYRCTPIEKTSVHFHSGASSAIGAYLSFLGISVGYMVDVDRIVGDHPSSKKIELGFSCARFTLQYFHMRNTGKMTLTIYDKEENKKYKVKDFTGLTRKSWGVSGYYFFNNSHYSHSAAYSCSKIQRISAGSWLAGFRIDHQNFSLRADAVDEKTRQLFNLDEGETLEDETMFDYTDFCLSGGYGYNWVLGPKWILNGTALLHTGWKHAHSISTSDGGDDHYALNSRVRLAATYSHRSFFASLQGYVDSHLFNTGQYRFSSHIFDLTAIVGVRF
jgi:hypothetical protein